MKMISMEMTQEMRERSKPIEASSKTEDSPKYPWGSQMTVEDEHVDSMGLSGVKVGDEVLVTGRARVVSSRSEDREGRTKRSVELQMTHMGASKPKKGPSTADVLYGKGGKVT